MNLKLETFYYYYYCKNINVAKLFPLIVFSKSIQNNK